MSECVVRMEMPKNRCPVRFSIAANGYCPIEDRSGCGLDVTKERPDWCPIICQLPEGHGRLVDADKEIDFHVNDFERVKTEGIDVYSKAYSLSDLCDGITYAYDHANIIVPVETGRKISDGDK